MSTVMPQSELLRKAVTYISEGQTAGKALTTLLDEASMRFNLSPKEADYLKQFFTNPESAVAPGP